MDDSRPELWHDSNYAAATGWAQAGTYGSDLPKIGASRPPPNTQTESARHQRCLSFPIRSEELKPTLSSSFRASGSNTVLMQCTKHPWFAMLLGSKQNEDALD